MPVSLHRRPVFGLRLLRLKQQHLRNIETCIETSLWSVLLSILVLWQDIRAACDNTFTEAFIGHVD